MSTPPDNLPCRDHTWRADRVRRETFVTTTDPIYASTFSERDNVSGHSKAPTHKYSMDDKFNIVDVRVRMSIVLVFGYILPVA